MGLLLISKTELDAITAGCISRFFGGWCERGELNPYGCPLDPKSSASASSATLASFLVHIVISPAKCGAVRLNGVASGI